jgi:hypothetical protein
MQWENSIWNYHKLALLTSIWVFILLSPPVFAFIRKSVTSQIWFALTVGMLVWIFVFIILHTYSSNNNLTKHSDEMR